jgi:[ribosomal protein S5]-alanine N-acetyltransferase
MNKKHKKNRKIKIKINKIFLSCFGLLRKFLRRVLLLYLIFKIPWIIGMSVYYLVYFFATDQKSLICIISFILFLIFIIQIVFALLYSKQDREKYKNIFMKLIIKLNNIITSLDKIDPTINNILLISLAGIVLILRLSYDYTIIIDILLLLLLVLYALLVEKDLKNNILYVRHYVLARLSIYILVGIAYLIITTLGYYLLPYYTYLFFSYWFKECLNFSMTMYIWWLLSSVESINSKQDLIKWLKKRIISYILRSNINFMLLYSNSADDTGKPSSSLIYKVKEILNSEEWLEGVRRLVPDIDYKNPPILKGPGFYLAPYTETEQDVKELHNILKQPECRLTAAGSTWIVGKQRALEEIQARLSGLNDCIYFKIVVLNPDGSSKLIGSIGIHHMTSKSGFAEIGFRLLSEYQGKGYTTEALKVIGKFFEECPKKIISDFEDQGETKPLRVKKNILIQLGIPLDTPVLPFIVTGYPTEINKFSQKVFEKTEYTHIKDEVSFTKKGLSGRCYAKIYHQK